jgi:uncharacterized protein (TIGR03435 family)
MSMNMGNTTLDGLAYTLSRSIDRPIVDKTGVSGGFDVFLKFARDTAALDVQTGSAPAAPSDPGEVSLATALEQFGLKLETSRGPREFLVVDRVERPTRN